MSNFPANGEFKPFAKGYSIRFAGVPGYHKLSDFTDAAIEESLAALEKATGTKLARDSRTDFPNFDVYKDGEEIGGG